MDKVKELIARKELIKRLVSKTEDEAELKKLSDEIDEINEAIIDAKAEAKAIEKAKEIAEKAEKEKEEKGEKEVKEAKKEKAVSALEIQVGNPAEYKGVNLKRASYIAGMKNPDIKETNKTNPELGERLIKAFTDMAADAGVFDGKPKAMTGGTTTAGGYLTATDERMEVVAYMRKNSVALRDANVLQMNTDTITYPKENGKVSVALRSEGSAVTATSPTFTQVELKAVNIDAYTDMSKELFMDSDTVIATLMSQFTEAGGQALDDYVFTGTGAPMSGIFTAAAGYSEVFSTGSTNFSEILSSNVHNIIAKVLATKQDTSKLKWYGHPSVMMTYLQTLQDDNGKYLFFPAYDGKGVGNILGYPVEYVYEATSASASGGCLTVFGDLSGVWLGERLNTMSLFYDPYTDAANGNDRFFWYTRWAFALAQHLKFGRIVSA